MLSDAALAGTSPPSTEYDALLVLQGNPSHVLLGTEHGLFETTDGGHAWQSAGLAGEPVTSLTRVGDTLLAGGRGLLAQSSNGGRTWRPLHPKGLPDEDIAALAATVGRRPSVYVVLGSGGLFRSTDDLRTFALVSPEVGPGIRAMATTPTRILAGDVVSGVYVSSDGQVWLHAAGGMVMSLAVSTDDPRRVLAASYGIALSRDGGLRWTLVKRSRAMFGSVAWAPGHPSLAYAIGDDRSFWRSTDGGRRWVDVGSRSR